jgi:hypothetical protein
MIRFKKVWMAAILIGSFLEAAYAEDTTNKKQSSLLNDLLTLPAQTAQDTDKILEETIFNLGEIRVTSGRVESDVDEEAATDEPHNITVIGSKEIKESASEAVPGVLNGAEGVTYTDDLGQWIFADLAERANRRLFFSMEPVP